MNCRVVYSFFLLYFFFPPQDVFSCYCAYLYSLFGVFQHLIGYFVGLRAYISFVFVPHKQPATLLTDMASSTLLGLQLAAISAQNTLDPWSP